MLARQVGHLTRFPSLELACEDIRKAGACDSGYSCAYQYNLSWISPTTPMPAESNPRLLFERLFGTGAPGERHANLRRRRDEQRSILDFALADARSMQRRLSSQDQGKLDEYLTGVRAIETRIEKTERLGDARDPEMPTPAGIPADYEQYIHLMYDMMILAFQTDSTRIATMMLAHDGSNRPFDEIGISEGHHSLTHHQNRGDWIEKVAEIDLFYARQFGRFLDKLRTTEDVDGKLAPAQLDDRLWQRQLRRQPPHPQRPPRHPRRRRRRHPIPGPPRPSRLPPDDRPLPQHGRSPRRPGFWPASAIPRGGSATSDPQTR